MLSACRHIPNHLDEPIKQMILLSELCVELLSFGQNFDAGIYFKDSKLALLSVNFMRSPNSKLHLIMFLFSLLSYMLAYMRAQSC